MAWIVTGITYRVRRNGQMVRQIYTRRETSVLAVFLYFVLCTAGVYLLLISTNHLVRANNVAFRASIAKAEKIATQTRDVLFDNDPYIYLKLPRLKAKSRSETWAKTKHQEIDLKLKSNPGVDILFLGDSITSGSKQSAAWKDYFAKYKTINGGISSDRIEHILWRVEHGSIDKAKPKVVVLLAGVNNLAIHSAKEIAGGTYQVINAIHLRSADTKILLLGIFPSGKKAENWRRKRTIETNDFLRLMADNKRVFYQDIGKEFLSENGDIAPSIMYDYLHLTAKGYDIWAKSTEKRLSFLLEQKSDKSKFLE